MAMRFQTGISLAAWIQDQDVDSIRGSLTLGSTTAYGMLEILKLTFFTYVRAHHLAAKHARETYRVVEAMESGHWVIYDGGLRGEINWSGTWLHRTAQDFFYWYITAWQQDLHARLVRTAARIVIVHDQSGILPSDEPALAAAGVLLPAMPMTTGRIRYERLNDHRFRVSADPAGPFPDPDLRKFIVSRNDFGKGASSNLLVDKHGSIEIDLAGLRAAKR